MTSGSMREKIQDNAELLGFERHASSNMYWLGSHVVTFDCNDSVGRRLKQHMQHANGVFNILVYIAPSFIFILRNPKP